MSTQFKSNVLISGYGELRCWDYGRLVWRRRFHNAPTTQGLQYLAGAGFDGGTTAKISDWRVGLIDTLSTGLADGDTISSHSGWHEFTGYSGSRPQWVNSGSGGLITSNGPFTFPITTAGTIRGAFIVSSTGSVLWATAILSSPANVAIGQNLTGVYSVQLVGS